LLLATVSLTGCGLIYDISTTIEDNESSTVSQKVLVESKILDGIAGGVIYSVADSYPQLAVILGVIKNNTIEYDGKKYYGYSDEKTFKDYDELEEFMTDSQSIDIAGYNMEIPALFSAITLSDDGMAGTVSKEIYSLDDSYEKYLSYIGGVDLNYQMNFTFPEEVVKSNGTIESDGKTVSWTITEDGNADIYADMYVESAVAGTETGSSGNTVLYILLGVVIFLLVALIVILIVLFVGKKKTAPKGQTCPRCGSPIKEDSKFCTNCGNRL